MNVYRGLQALYGESGRFLFCFALMVASVRAFGSLSSPHPRRSRPAIVCGNPAGDAVHPGQSRGEGGGRPLEPVAYSRR